MLYQGQNGSLYVTRRDAGDVLMLKDVDGDNKFEDLVTVLYDFKGVHGITIKDEYVYKIDIKNPSNVQKVKLDQYYLGADGLLLDDNTHLTLVVNGGNDKIFRLESTDGWQSAKLSATTLASDRFSYPSTATRFQNNTWIMNAKFSELVDSNSVPSKNFAIQKAAFKPVPKPKE